MGQMNGNVLRNLLTKIDGRAIYQITTSLLRNILILLTWIQLHFLLHYSEPRFCFDPALLGYPNS
jgi:hypothetical protein